MAVLMMFSKGLRMIPFEKVIPFNKDDLLFIAEKDIALRLTNIIDENENVFSISHIMENEKIFNCKNFDARCQEFAEIFLARLERYFDTYKVDYLFFDLEEQKMIEKIFKASNLNCSVVIYMEKDGEFKEAQLEELGFKESKRVLNILNKYKVRVVTKPDEYYKLKQISSKKTEETKKKFDEMAKKHEQKAMEKYFKRYSKLSSLKTKSEVNAYYKNLAKKYHPDRGGNSEIFVIINEDFNIIKSSKWFKRLPEE
ncbi:MAG: J domain-containing protein [Clostridia bacterium]|nr:J domain-containing protein [Clostridia bacterium]